MSKLSIKLVLYPDSKVNALSKVPITGNSPRVSRLGAVQAISYLTKGQAKNLVLFHRVVNFSS